MLNTRYPLLLQMPDGLPKAADNTPLDFTTPFDVIVFIILPIVIIILYFYWRRTKKGNRK
ncbi:MAG: adenylosuccinate synthetase [Gelidibacter sp.]